MRPTVISAQITALLLQLCALQHRKTKTAKTLRILADILRIVNDVQRLVRRLEETP